MYEKKLVLFRFVSKFWSLTSKKVLKHVQNVKISV